jgi:malate/lactate dehydrogenase
LKQCTGRIPTKNFAAMTRLDYNRATAQIAKKIKEDVVNVKNVIIWGNHSATQYPDATSDGYVENQWGCKIFLSKILKNDTSWLEDDFLKTVQQRGKAVIEARGSSSAMSAANAAADCVRTWLVTGTEPGQTVGMAVYNDKGYYGVKSGIM